MKNKIAWTAVATLALSLVAAAPAHAGPKTVTTYSYDVETWTETVPAVPPTYAAKFNAAELRTSAHYAATVSGLHIWTDNATTNAKAAFYQYVSLPLASIDAVSVEYSSVFGPVPVSQLIVDINGDNRPDGTLFGHSQYGDVFSLSMEQTGAFGYTGALPAFVALSPHVGPGYGSQYYGTLAEWSAAAPGASVRAVGFSLGESVYGDGYVTSVTAAGVPYYFTKVSTAGTPAQYAWVKTGHVDGATSVPADTSTTTRYTNVVATTVPVHGKPRG